MMAIDSIMVTSPSRIAWTAADSHGPRLPAPASRSSDRPGRRRLRQPLEHDRGGVDPQLTRCDASLLLESHFGPTASLQFGTRFNASEVMATAGGKQAIFNAVVTLCGPGDEDPAASTGSH